MKNVYESEHPHLQVLRDKFGQDAAYDLLRVLVWCPSAEPRPKLSCQSYVRGATSINYFQCDDDNEKIVWEVARWSNAFDSSLADKSDDRRLLHLSSALHSVLLTQPSDEAKVVFARTLRMMMFYEWILLGTNCSNTNPYAKLLPSLWNQFQELATELRAGQTRVLQTADGSWCVSLPLLVLLAIGNYNANTTNPSRGKPTARAGLGMK